MSRRQSKKSRAERRRLEETNVEAKVQQRVPTEPRWTHFGWSAWIALGFTLIIGAVLRFLFLNWKPPHFDEGINGFFVMKVWKDGYYHYDPTNFHGPLYFYVLQLAEVFFGRSIVAFRFVNGCLSLAVLVLVARYRRFFGRSALWAAAWLSISTAAVFYSRYAIHETLFIFFQILFGYGFFLYREKPSRFSIGLMVAGFFGCVTIKETFVVFFIIWAIAVQTVRLWERYVRKVPARPRQTTRANVNEWFVIGAFGFFICVAFFTGFFLNPQGYEDMFAALKVWTKTGTGNSGHEKPPIYWLQMFQLYEWPALLALISTPFVYFRVEARKKIIVLLAVGSWLAYTIIPYKTPWLILNLLWPLAFVLGFLIEDLANFKSRLARIGVRLILAVAVIYSSITMLRLNFRDFAKKGEPYVYVQSTEQMKLVLELVNQRLRDYPEDLNMPIQVLVSDPWPLPWVFGLFPKLMYGKPDSIEIAVGGVILIDGVDQQTLEKRLVGNFWRIPFQIRDSYQPGFAYVDFDKFKAYVPPGSAEIHQTAADLEQKKTDAKKPEEAK